MTPHEGFYPLVGSERVHQGGSTFVYFSLPRFPSRQNLEPEIVVFQCIWNAIQFSDFSRD